MTPSTCCPDCDSPLPAGMSALLCPVCALCSEATVSVEGLKHYNLEREIGRGGMGVVYVARQEQLRRRVAVKLLLGTGSSSAEARLRFQREAELVASLKHPGIVTVHEVGEHQGQPFIAMDLVDGPSLAERLKSGERMRPAEAATLVMRVADALVHAHERGVIHRDLKPSNILLRAEGEPVLADFGLARIKADLANITLPGECVGSPAYLPPERLLSVEGSAAETEDVYGLGAVLYHCLTGMPPFNGDSLAAIMHSVQVQVPLVPQLLNAQLPLDLQTICLRCLEKRPQSRYSSAAELREELNRYLKREPILARPLSPLMRWVRFAQRQPVLTALTLLLVGSVVVGSIISAWGWRQAAAEAELRRVQLYSSHMVGASAALRGGHPALARKLLGQLLPDSGQRDLRGPEWALLSEWSQPHESYSVRAHQHILTCMAWSPAGQRLMTGAHDGSVKLWQLLPEGGLDLLSTELPAGVPRVHQLQWVDEQHYLCAERMGVVCLREVGKKPPLWELPATQFSYAPAARRLLTSQGSAFHYEPAGRVCLWQLSGSATPQLLRQLPERYRAVALSPDGSQLAMAEVKPARGQQESGLLLMSLNAEAVKVLPTAGPVWSMAFSPAGSELAVTLFAGSMDVLRFALPQGTALPPLHGHQLRPWCVSYSAEGGGCFTSASDRSISQWQDGELKAQVVSAHENEVWCVAPHPQLPVLASGDKDGVLKLFPLPLSAGSGSRMRRLPHERYAPLFFTPDSTALHHQPAGGRPCLTAVSEGTAKGKAELCGYDHLGRAWQWPAGSEELLCTTASHLRYSCAAAGVSGAEVARGMPAGGRYCFRIHLPCSAVRLDLQTGQLRQVDAMFLSPAPLKHGLKASTLSADGRYLALATWHELAVHDFTTGQTLRLSNDPHWARDIAFSPDGRLMATAGIDGHLLLRSLPEGELVATLDGHLEEVSGLAFSPSGLSLISTEIGHGLRAWRLDTFSEVLHLPIEHTTELLQFSPDGQWLAVGLCPDTAAPAAGKVGLLRCALR